MDGSLRRVRSLRNREFPEEIRKKSQVNIERQGDSRVSKKDWFAIVNESIAITLDWFVVKADCVACATAAVAITGEWIAGSRVYGFAIPDLFAIRDD
jgi:hypothetical protein